MGTKKEKEKLSLPTMILCIVGVVLFGLGFMLAKNYNFKLTVIPSKGNVTSTQQAKDANGNVTNSIIVAYHTSSGDYNATINDNDNQYQLGSQVIVFYDFFSPEVVSLSFNGYQGYLCVIIGIILIINTGPRFIRIVRDNYIFD